MGNKGLRLEEKFILLIVAIGVICFGLLGYLSYAQFSSIIVHQRQEDAQMIAEASSVFLGSVDVDEIVSEEDAAFAAIKDELIKYHTNKWISNIYVLKAADGELLFLAETGDRLGFGLGEVYTRNDPVKLALEGSSISSEYSAYAPIKDEDGSVVGVVGVELAVDRIQQILLNLRTLVVVLVTFFAAFSILLSIWISSNLMNKDLHTEINNYEKLIKVGKSKEKRKKLQNYTGILIDIKDFSYLNQKLGSNGADLILRLYAKQLKTKIHRSEYVFSTGGDNFFALVKNNRVDEFLESIQKISIGLMVKDNYKTFHISSKCGVYAIPEKTTINEAMNSCTMALSMAKLQYDTDVKWFEKTMYDKMMHEQDVLNAFRVGIIRREFIVYYQPKVNIYTNQLCGAEALVRWFRNGKIVPPDQFIPVLEANNLITELDFYVFEQVCRDIKNWKDKNLDLVRISSNFSKLHLRNENFAEDILEILNKYSVDSSYIDTELTESSGFYDLDALRTFVKKMNDAKISVSIDDFGTGYSSLSLLKDLNVDVIKMDKSFFRDMEKGEIVQEKMVANVIRMVQDLQREVISEGIETEKQVDFLKKINSPIVQGFLFDKPLPHSEFEKRLRNPDYSEKFVSDAVG